MNTGERRDLGLQYAKKNTEVNARLLCQEVTSSAISVLECALLCNVEEGLTRGREVNAGMNLGMGRWRGGGGSESCKGSRVNRAWGAAKEQEWRLSSGLGTWGRKKIVSCPWLGSHEKTVVRGRRRQVG